ncbi:MAG: anti-sigma factor domain-containing protein [Rhodomicrobiaceae bacterium]
MDPNIPYEDGDDALAAEYALGVLDADERARVAERVRRDVAFARLVTAWETRLSGLNDGFVEVAPPRSVKAAIDSRLFGEADAPSRATASSIWSSLAFWRLVSGASLAAAALLAFFMLRSPLPPAAGENLLAYLAAEQSEDSFVALYDEATKELRITQVAGSRPSEKDHELWLIGDDKKAISLGLVGRTGEKAPSVAPTLRGKFAEGVTLAVTLEPEGGSPTGVATGPIIALGPAKKF